MFLATRGLVEWADAVIAVEPDLAVALSLQHPEMANKMLCLDSEVPDPRRPRAALSDYVTCRDLLERLRRRRPIYAPQSPSHTRPACRCPAGSRGPSSRTRCHTGTAYSKRHPLLVQARAPASSPSRTSVSAIWTVLSAAPFQRLSATAKNARHPAASMRMRPT